MLSNLISSRYNPAGDHLKAGRRQDGLRLPLLGPLPEVLLHHRPRHQLPNGEQEGDETKP